MALAKAHPHLTLAPPAPDFGERFAVLREIVEGLLERMAVLEEQRVLLLSKIELLERRRS